MACGTFISFGQTVGTPIVGVLIPVQIGPAGRAAVILPVLIHDSSEEIDACECAGCATAKIKETRGFRVIIHDKSLRDFYFIQLFIVTDCGTLISSSYTSIY